MQIIISFVCAAGQVSS